MKPMSPMAARRSLAYAEKYDTHLAIGHRRALETIANMREEWSRQARITGDPEWHPIRWCRSRDEAERTYWTRSLPTGARVEYRLVPRYVIEPETTDAVD